MRILFAGTPEIAVPSLEALCKSPHIEVAGVLTNPDRPVGRGQHLEPTPVKKKALELGLRVFQPEKIDGDFFDQIRFLRPQLLVVFAYGKIFTESFLTLFLRGGVNIHPSLLPQWRGSSPISAAILSRQKETGLTIQTLHRRMDCGDILYQEKLLLSGRETTQQLSTLFSTIAAEAIVPVVENFDEVYENRQPQEEEVATYCQKIGKEEGLIDWNSSVEEIDALIRAYIPWPKAYTIFNHIELYFLEAAPFPKSSLPVSLLEREVEAQPGEVFGFLKKVGFLIKTGDGILSVSVLQLKARKALEAAAFKNGSPEIIGTRLGS